MQPAQFLYCEIQLDNGSTRSPAAAEGPRDAGVPVEIFLAVERLYYTPNEYRSRVSVSLMAYVKEHSHRID